MTLLRQIAPRVPSYSAGKDPLCLLRQIHIPRNEVPVLLVDDDPGVAPLVGAALEPFQIRFDAVKSGGEAMARIRKRNYGLVILDLGLEDVHGFDVLRDLRAQPRYQDTKVLVVTANTSLEALARSFGHGADDFVRKPFDVHELAMRAFRLLQQTSA